jgi:hypothetical protein
VRSVLAPSPRHAQRGPARTVRIRTAAIVAVSALAVVPLARAAQLNIASLRLVQALASTHPAQCAVHQSLCVQVGGDPALTGVAAQLEPFVPVSEFSAQAVALAKAASGDVEGAERAWQQTPGALARLNLGRLYWTTGREAAAVETWRAAGEPTWIGLLLRYTVDPKVASPSTDRLVRLVLDELGGSYESDLLAGFVGLRFRHYMDAVSRFQRALAFRPGDRSVLMGLAEAYGSAPRQQLTRAEHAAIAGQMEAVVRFDPGYSDLHVLAAVAVCLGRGDYATAEREAETARRLGFGPLPADLTQGLARRCEAVR